MWDWVNRINNDLAGASAAVNARVCASIGCCSARGRIHEHGLSVPSRFRLLQVLGAFQLRVRA